MAAEPEKGAYESDPARWGHSLSNIAEVLTGCLDAAGARSVAEVGAYAGDLTRLLLDWAAGAGASVVAIEPTPQPRLVEFTQRHPELELIEGTSHEALRDLPLPDAVVIDGDHNYFTVSEELRLIEERAPAGALPLLMLHDVGWPHGRRDAYYAPDRIPEEHRQPMVDRAQLFPGDPGLVDGGIPMYASARREGGPRNGVLTAVEDLVDRRNDLRLATLAPFFGFGVVWHRDAPWAAAVAEVVDPWDRNPVLERLEANRVYHLATSHSRSVKLMWTKAQLKKRHEETQARLRKLREENAKLREQRAASRAKLQGLREENAKLRGPRDKGQAGLEGEAEHQSPAEHQSAAEHQGQAEIQGQAELAARADGPSSKRTGDGRVRKRRTEEQLRAGHLKRGTSRPIRALGPRPGAESLRAAYLELLKLALCDLAGARTLSVSRTGDTRDPDSQVLSRELGAEELALRARGSDWPFSGLTMVGLRRLDDLQACLESVVVDQVEGDVIEAGTWRGGASILGRATLDSLGADERTVWLADSFQGLPAPDRERFPEDRDLDLSRVQFLAVPAEEVRGYFARFGCERGVELVEGLFDETLPGLRDRRWAVVRLDGDTYEATWVALDSLYPGLSAGGYLIIDDYGLIEECRRAVDDYRREHGITEPIEKIDWNGIRWRRESQPAPIATGDAERTTRRSGGGRSPKPTAGKTRVRVPTERELELERELGGVRERLRTAEDELQRLNRGAPGGSAGRSTAASGERHGEEPR